jgi:NAD(P)-dependent dehydrogenase (short-subunit alcohol dehydrogenase family)
MDLGLEGKIALVTGASRGIGRAIVGKLAEEGADVMLVARNAANLEKACADIRETTGRRAELCSADLSGPHGIQTAFEAVRRTYGRIDILVNNAGDTRSGDFLTLDEEAWESGFALKFFGYVRMCRTLWPMLKESHGTVINIVGTGALTPGPHFAIGGSINAAVANFSKALANLGLADDVNVNVVHPGTVAETDRYETLLARSAEALGLERDEAARRSLASQGIRRFALPADVATVTAFLASPLARHVQGTQTIVDGGSTKGL